jgi:hypothetical protein
MMFCVPLLVTTLAATSLEDPAVAAARKRQQAVRTARFEVHVREVHAKGSKSERAGVPTDNPLPTEEVIVESDNVLVFSGGNVRVEENHPKWNGSHFAPFRVVEASEGRRVAVFYPDGDRGDPTPTASIRDILPPVLVKGFLWLPLTATVRGLSPEAEQFPVRSFRSTGVTEMIDDDHCREYATPPRAGWPDVRYWLASDKGYVVRRIRVMSEGRVYQQLDIRYRSNESAGWLPSDWVTTEHGRDGPALVTTAVAVTAARLNEPVPDEALRISFPPGTRVKDKGGKKYRVEPDGSWSEIEAEAGPPDDLPLWPAGPRGQAWVAGLAVAAGLAALLAVWLRLRRPALPRR